LDEQARLRNSSTLTFESWTEATHAATTALVAFLATNLLAVFCLRGLKRQVISRVDRTAGITQLAIGNSLIAYGYDSTVFDNQIGGGFRSLNAGISGSSPVEDLLKLRRGIAHQPKLRAFTDFTISS
jgi:hypothetical protein